MRLEAGICLAAFAVTCLFVEGASMSGAAGRSASSGVRGGIVWLSLVMLTVGVGIGSCVAETWRGLVAAP